MIFKCRNCGGNVIYSPEKKKMFCPFCESEESDERKEYTGDIRICPECGGEVPVEEHTSAARCPFCDNYIIFNERVEGRFTPELIIPFSYSREMVKELMRTTFKKCTFAPTDFLSEARLNTMEGDYVPFWLFDYKTNCQYRGEGRNTRVWVSSNIEYTETSVYEVYRNMDIKFSKIPADASQKMPDHIMDLMEPYKYSELQRFKPEFLSGFYGEKYNIEAASLEGRAVSKMEKDAGKMLKESIAGYGSLIEHSKNVRVEEKNTHYSLLPVWTYTYEYRGKKYPFYINGQTAKVIGTVPISVGKVWAYGITLWAVLAAVMGLLYTLL